MKKPKSLDSWGRSVARKRYAVGGGVSDSLKSGDISIGEPDEGTDSYYARQEEKMGVPADKRHYGDPEPVNQMLRDRSRKGRGDRE